jgi:hypothetical protein
VAEEVITSLGPRQRSSRRLVVDGFFVGWVYGPWFMAAITFVMALRLLIDSDFSNHGHGWGLIGSAAICFSIGCVCKTSWGLAQRKR